MFQRGVVSSTKWQNAARINSLTFTTTRSSSTLSSILSESITASKADSSLFKVKLQRNAKLTSTCNLANTTYPIRSFSSEHGKETAQTQQTEPTEEQVATPKNKESLEFKAETKQLLDIVTHSLYTDKEVFLRELISNASDALEKLRHLRVANTQSSTSSQQLDPDIPLEIQIETDEVNGTITIRDTGVGLTRQDMIEHLGTIAKSGSKAFMNELKEKHSADGAASMDISRGIIGKFGVGFYSAFMVGDKVEVRSK